LDGSMVEVGVKDGVDVTVEVYQVPVGVVEGV
jgi:hypothetical protein